MAKLEDRSDVHEAQEHVREAPARVPPSREVEEHHRRVTEAPAPATKGVRWLRWIPVVLLIAAGLVVLGIIISSDDATNPGPNADLPEVATLEQPPLAPIAGPNAGLPEVSTLEPPALAPIAGPNADLPEVATAEPPPLAVEAELNGDVAVATPYDAVEANRTEALRDLAATD